MPWPEGDRPTGPPICPARSGPSRQQGWSSRRTNTSLAVASDTARPSGTQPPALAPPHWAGGPAAGRRPVVAPGLSERDVLAAEVTSGKAIIGNSRQQRRVSRPRASSTGGLAGRQGAGVVVNAMPRFRCRRRHGRDDTGRTPACDSASTGHVWITIWHRYGRDPFPDVLAAQPANSISPGNGGGAARVSPGMSAGTGQPSGVLAQFIDECCAQPPTLVISPGLA